MHAPNLKQTTTLDAVAAEVGKLVAGTKLPEGVRVDIRGMAPAMYQSFGSFAIGLTLAAVLLVGIAASNAF